MEGGFKRGGGGGDEGCKSSQLPDWYSLPTDGLTCQGPLPLMALRAGGGGRGRGGAYIGQVSAGQMVTVAPPPPPQVKGGGGGGGRLGLKPARICVCVCVC